MSGSLPITFSGWELEVQGTVSELGTVVELDSPTAESTVDKRRQHRARNSKRGVPGNPPTQISLRDIKDLA